MYVNEAISLLHFSVCKIEEPKQDTPHPRMLQETIFKNEKLLTKKQNE